MVMCALSTAARQHIQHVINLRKVHYREHKDTLYTQARFGRQLFLIWMSVKIHLHITSVIKLMIRMVIYSQWSEFCDPMNPGQSHDCLL